MYDVYDKFIFDCVVDMCNIDSILDKYNSVLITDENKNRILENIKDIIDKNGSKIVKNLKKEGILTENIQSNREYKDEIIRVIDMLMNNKNEPNMLSEYIMAKAILKADATNYEIFNLMKGKNKEGAIDFTLSRFCEPKTKEYKDLKESMQKRVEEYNEEKEEDDYDVELIDIMDELYGENLFGEIFEDIDFMFIEEQPDYINSLVKNRENNER